MVTDSAMGMIIALFALRLHTVQYFQ